MLDVWKYNDHSFHHTMLCRLFYAGAVQGQMPEILSMIQVWVCFWPEQCVCLFARTRVKKNIPSLYLAFEHRSTSQPLPLPFWLWWESRLLSLILILPLKLKTIVDFTLTFYFLSIWKSQAALSLVYLTSSNILMLIEFTGFATWVRKATLQKLNSVYLHY